MYDSPNRNKMLSSVIQFSKGSTTSDDSQYIEDIVQIIKEMPKFYSHDTSLQDHKVTNHLKGVIRYREKIRAKSPVVSQ